MNMRVPSKAFLVAITMLACTGCAALDGRYLRRAAIMEEAAAERSPMKGRRAPDFTLPDANGQRTTLSRFRGRWVVLYFYPKAGTPGCTCQAEEFTKLLGRFEAQNGVIIGVSDDAPEENRAFIEQYNLRVTLLSDTEHTVADQYGAWVTSRLIPDRGRIVRSTFLVDPSGVIRYHWPEVAPEGHAERVRRKLVAVQQEAP